jgi:hypothetical protein
MRFGQRQFARLIGKGSRIKEDEAIVRVLAGYTPRFAVAKDHAKPDSVLFVDTPRSPNRAHVVATIISKLFYSRESAVIM